jgi:uncharacterized membrane protein YhaH (DUF805 family)
MEKLESNYNIVDWWKKVVLKNYANFNGRARRAEYWNFALANFLSIIGFYILGFIGMASEISVLSMLGFGIYGLAALATLIPGIAAVVRRLHDTNKSGWYYFMALIPIAGPIILLVALFKDGDRFTNNYGDDPKNPAGTPEFDFEQKS